MIIIDTIKIAAKSLWGKKVRSFLSLLGIIIGILTVSGLLTLSLGVKRGITSSIQDLGANILFVLPGRLSESGAPNISQQFGASTLTETDYKFIKEKIPEAQNVSIGTPVVGTVSTLETTVSDATIFATSPGADKVLNMIVETGRFIDENDNKERKRSVVLGSDVKLKLFGLGSSLGKKVRIRGEDFTVVGVLARKDDSFSFGGPSFNDLVEIPIETAWEITGVKQIFRIMMQAPSAESVQPVKEKIYKILLENHGGEEDFSVVTQDDILVVLGNIFDILTAMLTAVSTIALLIGGIGIMNIMLVSVSERTREIGIRKAVGATRYNILLQFLVESIILTLLSGVIAMVIFASLLKLLKDKLPFPLELEPSVLLLSLTFSAGIGIIFGVIPAVKASLKDPVDALRYE